MSGRVVVVVASLVVAACAHSQNPAESVRLISSVGTAGTTGPRDLAPAIGFGTRVSWRLSEFWSLGIHDHLLLRNWSAVDRYYSDAWNCEKLDTRCDTRADYWAIGWALAFSTAEAGIELMMRPKGPNKPWLTFGNAAVLYANGHGFAEDGAPSFDLGHAGTIGVGYDRGSLGFGVRASYANDRLIFGQTGDPILTMLLSIEVIIPIADER